MSRMRRLSYLVAGFAFLVYVVFRLSLVREGPLGIESSAVSIETVKKGPIPEEIRGAAESVAGTEILYVKRPFNAEPEHRVSVFKIVEQGEQVERVAVKFGRGSTNVIEVLDGLREGDKIIVSDMSAWDQYDRIRLK